MKKTEITKISAQLSLLKNKVYLLEQDIECLHMNLDDEGIPRKDGGGNVYSMWGRVNLLLER